MQDPILLAFRKRLKKRGYYDISICRAPSEGKDYYRVYCNEPLAGVRIVKAYPLTTFHRLMR